jgi:hypothetical protein
LTRTLVRLNGKPGIVSTVMEDWSRGHFTSLSAA